MSEQFTDKWLICVSCGKQFLWDAGEQSWYRLTNLKNQPRHCKHCREARKKHSFHSPFGAPAAATGR